jgi:hypothetical protein
MPAPTMTLEDFGRTRRYLQDLGNQGGLNPMPGFEYEGGLHIELVRPHWVARAEPHQGDWCLTIGSEQTFSDSIGDLEERLYHYAVDEQIVRHPDGNLSMTEAGRLVAELREAVADATETVKLLDQRIAERDAELTKLRGLLTERDLELRDLRAGYDVIRHENVDMAATLKSLLLRIDCTEWHAAVLRGRQLLTKHEELPRG